MVSMFTPGFVIALFSVTVTARVSLLDGGYSGIVAYISPWVNPDNVTANFQLAVEKASSHLYNWTGGMFFLKHVQLVYPYNAPPKADGILLDASQTASVGIPNADILIGPADKRHSFPGLPPRLHVVQAGQCGAQGWYIHIPEDALWDQEDTKRVGKELAVAWAMYRYGVFSEESLDRVYFNPYELNYTASYCADKAVPGDFVHAAHQHPCRLDETGNPTEKCVFVPTVLPNETFASSVLFGSITDQVDGFCDNDTHNTLASTPHNRYCSGRSAWDVIRAHSDYTSTTTADFVKTSYTFSVTRASPRILLAVKKPPAGSKFDPAIIVALSTSLTLYFVAMDTFFPGTAEFGVLVFNETNIVEQLPVNVTNSVLSFEEFSLFEYSNGKNELELDAAEAFTVCDAINKAREMLNETDVNQSGTVLLFTLAPLREAECNFSSLATDDVISPVVIIALNASDDPTVILDLANQLEGHAAFIDTAATPDLNWIKAMDAALYSSLETEENALMTVHSEVIEVTDQLVHLLSIDQHLVKAGFVVSILTDNTTLDSVQSILIAAPQSTYFVDATCPQIEGQPVYWCYFPPSEAADEHHYPWSIRILMNPTTPAYTGQFLVEVLGHPTSDGAITAIPRLSTNQSPQYLSVVLEDSGNPIIHAAVEAVAFSADGSNVTLTLWDDGTGADVWKHDGVYTAQITEGVKSGLVSAHFYAMATPDTQVVVDHAEHHPNQDSCVEVPEHPDYCLVTVPLEQFHRQPPPLYFIANDITNETHIERITDLQECTYTSSTGNPENAQWILCWTAPHGPQAKSYNLCYFKDPSSTETSNQIKCVNNVNTPKPSGSEETYQIMSPTEISDPVPGLIYVAIQSTLDTSTLSHWSNMVAIPTNVSAIEAPTTMKPSTIDPTSAEPTTDDDELGTGATPTTDGTSQPSEGPSPETTGTTGGSTGSTTGDSTGSTTGVSTGSTTGDSTGSTTGVSTGSTTADSTGTPTDDSLGKKGVGGRTGILVSISLLAITLVVGFIAWIVMRQRIRAEAAIMSYNEI